MCALHGNCTIFIKHGGRKSVLTMLPKGSSKSTRQSLNHASEPCAARIGKRG